MMNPLPGPPALTVSNIPEMRLGIFVHKIGLFEEMIFLIIHVAGWGIGTFAGDAREGGVCGIEDALDASIAELGAAVHYSVAIVVELGCESFRDFEICKEGTAFGAATRE